jgi:aminoglycoside 3-N-acetyltransferase
MTAPVSTATLVEQLLTLGVAPGGVLVVHTAFSRVRPVEGGPLGLISALRQALGPEGTLVMPSMSWDDEHVFDAQTTPCPEMGIVAETFWRQPGVLRGDNAHAFAAIGPYAATITGPQPLDVPHGPDSPPGRVHTLDGQVLLLGVGQDSNTTIHLGEALAGVRYRSPKTLMLLQDGRPMRFHYSETDHCCENFSLVDGWLAERGQLARGTVGHAEARLMRSRHIVSAVVDHLRQNETAFLHPYGVDEECDEARASLPAEAWRAEP